ncbi:MAG: 23S rRNA (uracil(1939)-C(5))-methyltransferase RlmD [Oscillospiraceae bacterium]|jgi:23S rRNA (uracil1939-C5)-methyltransferase|nr:23S rRNA (uracil(1939)-C(5))-methyltransferase RlmD [Oscillospiraceae bacterium]
MDSLKKNDTRRAVIEDCTSAGLGVAHVEGRAVFVEGAARGDECLLRIVKAPDSGPVYARIETLLVPSPARVTPACPHFGRCGGCDFQHVTYEEELALKEARIREAFRRIAKIDLTPEKMYPAPATRGCRNKALFPVRAVEGRPVTGFFRPRSHTLVPVDACLLQNAAANACAAALRAWMTRHRVPAYDETTGEGLIRNLFVRTGERTGQTLCCLAVTRPKLPQAPALTDMLRAACPGLVGLVLDVNPRPGNVALSGRQRTLWGAARLEDELCSLRFSLSAMSFYQVNAVQAEALYAQAETLAGLTGRETVLELYCGAGTLSLCLARTAGQVIGVDIVPEAIRDARQNALGNGLTNVEFRQADAGQAARTLAEAGIRPDVLVFDPPRRGVDEAVLSAVKELAPPRVVYLSCDPATLARDVFRLADMGYRAVRCAAVDMFPRTANVETVCALERNPNVQ